MSGLLMPAAIIIACVLCQGFFSGSEIAIVSSRWGRLRREAEAGDRRAALLVRMWGNPDRLLATTLVGTNLSVIVSSVLATYLVVTLVSVEGSLMARLAGREELLVTVFLAPLTLVVGEVVPKSIFQTRANRMAKGVAYPMALAWMVFLPVTSVLTVFSRLVKTMVGSRVKASPFVTREELAMIVRLRDLKTELKKHERRMIKRLFAFRETRVREVMIPMVRVVAHEEGTSVSQALSVFRSTRYTRYPVFRKRLFTVVGVLDMLSCLHEPRLDKKVERLMVPPRFVPESKSVVDLLHEMQREMNEMAVVVDEYGGAVGIVTVEDILEEIVGELEDEYEIQKVGLRRVDKGLYEADAHLDIELVSEKLGLTFPGGDFETLAGLMAGRLGRIPVAGEEVSVEGAVLRALEVNERTVERVLVRLLEPGA